MIEIGRTWQGKTFDLGNGKRRLVHAFTPVHYYDNGFHDIDLTPVDKGSHWLIERAPYVAKFYKDRPLIEYASRQGGEGVLRLRSIGSQTSFATSPRFDRGRFIFQGIGLDQDVYWNVRPAHVEPFHELHSASARPDFIWEVEADNDLLPRIGDGGRAWDSREIDGSRRRAEVEHVRGARSRNGNRWHWSQEERFTGRAFEREPVTRREVMRTDIEYPVLIDPPDITEGITVGNDDGASRTGVSFWSGAISVIRGGKRFGNLVYTGLRFQTIGVGPGDTIDLANLKVNVATVQNAGDTGTIHADDVDDAAAFSNANLPRNITKTTASASFAGTTTGLKTIDVTTIVQEVVDRGSWASDNDMRFVIFPAGVGGNYDYWIGDAYETGGGTPATLEIDFTAAGPPSGTIAQTAPSASQAATGLEIFKGPASQTAPSATQAATGVLTFKGPVAQIAPAATQSAAGINTWAEIAQTAPAATQALAGVEIFKGSIAQTAPSATQAAVGRFWVIVDETETIWTEV